MANSGRFIFRGFGPAPFQLGGRAPIKNDAINKAAGVGQPVTQLIAVTVKGDSISCSINNKVVATHPRSDVVAPGKLKSTDGHYGLRFGHNTDATVTDFKKQRHNNRPQIPVAKEATRRKHLSTTKPVGLFIRLEDNSGLSDAFKRFP